MAIRHLSARLAAFFVAAMASTALGAECGALDIRHVRDWLGKPLSDIAGEALGPQGGRIFAKWTAERDPVSVAGLLVITEVKINLGEVQERQAELYLDPRTFRVNAVVVAIDPAMQIDLVERLVGRKADLRLCGSHSMSPVADSALELLDRDDNNANLAVFPEERLVAEMFQAEGMVEALRWIAGTGSLSGCP